MLVRWLGMLLWTLASQVAAQEFDIKRLDCALEQDLLVLQAEIHYRLSDEVRRALEHGVPLNFSLQLELRRAHDPWWKTDRYHTTANYRIYYHALASMYQVSDEDSPYPRTFATLDAALDALGRVRNLPIMDASQLESGTPYMLTLRAELDLDALPLPLRPMAYLSPSWSLSSDYQRCSLTP